VETLSIVQEDVVAAFRNKGLSARAVTA
jgi:hypothetical protein